jgi:hypothetical protein
MSWWNSQKAAQILEREPPVDRYGQVQAEMKLAKQVLDGIGAEILAFRTKYKLQTDLLDRIVRCEIPSVRRAQAIYSEWAALQKRKGAALHRFSASLKVWAELKGKTQHANS